MIEQLEKDVNNIMFGQLKINDDFVSEFNPSDIMRSIEDLIYTVLPIHEETWNFYILYYNFLCKKDFNSLMALFKKVAYIFQDNILNELNRLEEQYDLSSLEELKNKLLLDNTFPKYKMSKNSRSGFYHAICNSIEKTIIKKNNYMANMEKNLPLKTEDKKTKEYSLVSYGEICKIIFMSFTVFTFAFAVTSIILKFIILTNSHKQIHHYFHTFYNLSNYLFIFSLIVFIISWNVASISFINDSLPHKDMCVVEKNNNSLYAKYKDKLPINSIVIKNDSLN